MGLKHHIMVLLCGSIAIICYAATPSGVRKPPLSPAKAGPAVPSGLPLHFAPHERVAIFARPCDGADDRQRPNSYTALDDPMKVFDADTYLCFFGFNEAFAGVAG